MIKQSQTPEIPNDVIVFLKYNLDCSFISVGFKGVTPSGILSDNRLNASWKMNPIMSLSLNS